MGRKIGEVSAEVIALVQKEQEKKQDVKISCYIDQIISATNTDATRKPPGVKGCKYFPLNYFAAHNDLLVHFYHPNKHL